VTKSIAMMARALMASTRCACRRPCTPSSGSQSRGANAQEARYVPAAAPAADRLAERSAPATVAVSPCHACSHRTIWMHHRVFAIEEGIPSAMASVGSFADVVRKLDASKTVDIKFVEKFFVQEKMAELATLLAIGAFASSDRFRHKPQSHVADVLQSSLICAQAQHRNYYCMKVRLGAWLWQNR
jgi:hypothetical protein